MESGKVIFSSLLRERVEQLSAENDRLRAEQAAHEAKWLSANERRARVTLWLAKTLAGPDVATSAKRILKRLKTTRSFDDDELIEFAAAIFNRLYRVGVWTIVVALIPFSLSTWQTLLLRAQNSLITEQNTFLQTQTKAVQEQIDLQQSQIHLQRSESEAVRAASLLETLYNEEECQLKGQQPCPIAANARARAEAVVAYAQIMRSKLGSLPIANAPFGRSRPYPDGPKVNLVDIDLSRLILWGADLSLTDFSRGRLAGAKLSDTNLSRSVLGYADLRFVDFQFARLDGADLSFCDCQGANFVRASLKNAVLLGADFKHTVLNASDLSGADIRNVDFTNAIISSRDATPKLTGAIYDDFTLWPEGFSEALAQSLGAIHVADLPIEAKTHLTQFTNSAGVTSPPGRRYPYRPEQ